MPSPALAETSTSITSPPHFSTTNSCSESWRRTRSGSASVVSILLMATMMGTSAALMWSIASTVCGMTPSSAATTSTAMSVTCAPRARIAVNASWPGVSMNVTGVPLCTTWYAPICCVMPSASLATTFVRRMVSSSVVLPWSTWPSTVTTAGRVSRSADSSSATAPPAALTGSSTFRAAYPNTRATPAAVSKSTIWLMLANTPPRISCLMTCTGSTRIRSASTPTAIASPMGSARRVTRRVAVADLCGSSTICSPMPWSLRSPQPSVCPRRTPRAVRGRALRSSRAARRRDALP